MRPGFAEASLGSASAEAQQDHEDGLSEPVESIAVVVDIAAEGPMRTRSLEGLDTALDETAPLRLSGPSGSHRSDHDNDPSHEGPSSFLGMEGARESRGTAASHSENRSDNLSGAVDWYQEVQPNNHERLMPMPPPSLHHHHQDPIRSMHSITNDVFGASSGAQEYLQSPPPQRSTVAFSPSSPISLVPSSSSRSRVENVESVAGTVKPSSNMKRRNRPCPSPNATARSSRSHNAALFEAAAISSMDSDSTLITRDSFGYAAYHPLFRQHAALGEYHALDSAATRSKSSRHPQQRAIATWAGSGGTPGIVDNALHVPMMSDVPWDLRNTSDQYVKTFAFLSTRYFWFLIEYALRVTVIAMLVPAAIINTSLPHKPFVSTTFALTSVVLAAGTNSGQVSLFLVHYVKASVIWLPLSTICVALKLNRHLVAWFFVYVLLLFLIGTFTEKMTRRLCLLLYNICMVNLLTGDENLLFPARVLVDWAIGAAFALLAMLIPYPLLATRISAQLTKTMFSNTATCFTGILSCFWALSNTERSMSMVRIRSLVRTLDNLIEKFDSHDFHTFYEVLIYETSECREVRKEKVNLLLKLKMDLRAMERVINMLQEKPQMINQSQRCSLLRDHLAVPMDDISRCMEILLWKLSAAKKYDELKTLGGYFDAAGRSIKCLQNEFAVGRRVLLYEHQKSIFTAEDRMEEFLPLITFFVFSIVNFWATLEEFHHFINRHKTTKTWRCTVRLIWNAVWEPFVENAVLIRLLCVRRAEPELRIVLEAAKVSVAMLISVIFFFYVDKGNLLFSGPTIIAFVSGMNPVEAVQAGAARMSGTLIGSVLGFFAASLCKTAIDRVTALCVITFVMTFLRPGAKYGVVCMYCNFVAVSALAPAKQTAAVTISRIQQNTFAIFIYCLISVAVFPVSPNEVLFKKRMAVMRVLNSTVQKLTALFNDAAQSYVKLCTEKQDGVKRLSDMPIPITLSIPGFQDLDEGLTSLAHKPMNSDGNIFGVNLMSSELNGKRASFRNRTGSFVAMPGTFTSAPEDTVVKNLFIDVFEMLDIMKETSSVMPLAADEFQLTPQEYPQRASADIHAALYRLCALVYTMTCSWKTMREKNYFTPDMLHILHNLAPIANDIGRCLDRFVHVMEFYVHSPSSGLSSELTKSATQFRVLCVELSIRKERDLFAVARQTIMKYRIRKADNKNNINEAARSDSGDGSDSYCSEGRRHQRSHVASAPPRRPRRGRLEQKKSRNRSDMRWRVQQGGRSGAEPSRNQRWRSGSKRHRDGNSGGTQLFRTSRHPTHHSNTAPRGDVGGVGSIELPYRSGLSGNAVETPLFDSTGGQAPTHIQNIDDATTEELESRGEGVVGGAADDTCAFDASVSPSPGRDSEQGASTQCYEPHGSRSSAHPHPHINSRSGAHVHSRTPSSRTSSPPAQSRVHASLTPLPSVRSELKRCLSARPDTYQGFSELDLSTLRAEKLRENIRNLQRQVSSPSLTKRRRSAVMRTFGASYGANYVDLTELRPYGSSQDDVAMGESHHRHGGHTHYLHHRVPRSHLQEQPARGHGHSTHLHGEDQNRGVGLRLQGVRHPYSEGRDGGRTGVVTGYGKGAEGRASYSACEVDAGPLEPSTHIREGDAPSINAFDTPPRKYVSEGASTAGPASTAASPSNQRTRTEPHSTHRRWVGETGAGEQDSGDTHLHKPIKNGSGVGVASPSPPHSSSPLSYDRGEYSRLSSRVSESWGSASSDSDDKSSLVRFNDSFKTPITVQDAEGLHSFTLSLEMFSKELRRVLFGFEEMMQSL